ncbi:hypothetical protein [Jiella avicenniae]|uniref:Uncharacterized protein n=1 Tax=Jiella avicenniae TaxID=2907202 RepID=A0A9X1NVF2_9HYPH|nr:hypothetical protein [Jiella avicenniae]MCE7026415.1 hypothetical protein [Jiella avicenniae]
MATDPKHGLSGAVGLDLAARGLSEKDEAGEAVQDDLFAGSSVFGTLQVGGKPVTRSGPGRPKGSRNRSTAELAKLISTTGRHPVLAMAEIVSTPIDVIAATLGCKRIEAAEYHRKVMADLAPYVAQKMPTAVQVEGATAGMLTIVQLGQATGGGGLSEHGLALTLAGGTGDDESEENQTLSDDEAEVSHDDASHGGDK